MNEITGARFGRLEVVNVFGRKAAPDKHNTAWCRVRCDCGVVKEVRRASLVTGLVKSCGCLRLERARENVKKATAAAMTSKGNLRHGRSHTLEWYAWVEMRKRCRNPNDAAWARYGGRGIKVCERWQAFDNFFADMGPCPDKFTLDRIDNDGPYSPKNCRWASREDQANNRSSNRVLVAFGRAQTLAQWSRETKIPEYTISRRLDKMRWTVENSLI